jgi:hypothetical protein
MTLPIPVNLGDWRWFDVLQGTNSHGFSEIRVYKQTGGISMTDENETVQSVAKDINELYNQIPWNDLYAIYNNDENKATYGELIANFKTRDSERNKKILPLLTGNANDLFNKNL